MCFDLGIRLYKDSALDLRVFLYGFGSRVEVAIKSATYKHSDPPIIIVPGVLSYNSTVLHERYALIGSGGYC